MFLSGHGDAAKYESFLNEHQGRSLTKPVDLPDLQRRVRQILRVDGR
jgi:hypothetical protein